MVQRKQLNIKTFNTGNAKHIERLVLEGGRFKEIEFPAAAFLIQHPEEGNILFDTGYSTHFNDAKSTCMPFCMYPMVVPFSFDESQSLSQQLLDSGIKTTEINHIIVSHFHADHVSGLLDFPNSNIHSSRNGYELVKDKTGLSALTDAFFPHFLPGDLESRLSFIDDNLVSKLPNEFKPFEYGYDVFKDGSIYSVSIPGHGRGQMGLIIPETQKGPLFLAADACWVSDTYKEMRLPSFLTRIVNKEWNSYVKTLEKINGLYKRNSDIAIVPSHCKESVDKMIKNE